MRRSSRAVWVQRVADWQESGLPAKAYAKRIGVKPGTLSHWKWQLGHESRNQEEPSALPLSSGVAEVHAGGVSFVEVIAGASVAVDSEPFEVTLVGGRRVRVPARFDVESLRTLLTVLEPTS